MNYYPHHIGDYLRDTSHLSLMEHGAYRRMLDLYYASEKPLPLNIDGLYRLVQAKTRPEKEAVDTILEEFFQRAEDGWHNKRADEEIVRAAEDGAEAKAKRENELERQRRHRERRSKLFEELRGFGEVPKWDTPTEQLEALLVTHQSRTCHGDRPSPVTPPETDLQRLTNTNTNTNTKKKQAASGFVVPEWVSKDDWNAFEESRKKLRKPMTDRARELVILELSRLREAGNDPAAVLEQSIRKGYLDVFPLKDAVRKETGEVI